MTYNTTLLLTALSLVMALPAVADEPDAPAFKYRRSSIYSMMIKHTGRQFSDTIANVFVKMPVPDKYNDHDLSVKIVSTSDDELTPTAVATFLESNGVASRLVSKWFDRDALTGTCDVAMLQERGLYSASEADKRVAAQTLRGRAALEDAGEELIGNTFVLVNDIKYIDRSKGSSTLGGFLRFAGGIASVFSGDDSYSDAGEQLGSIAESYKGFKVKIYTHLYQLQWDETAQNTFNTRVWTDSPDPAKVDAMNLYRDKFKLKYIGSQLSDGSNTSFMGINESEPELMVRKACQRALDDNVANLQRNYEAFKVKEPLLTVEPLTAQIGRKEGMTDKSRYEVLEVVEQDGRTTYKRVGVIRPVSNQIWDNRFMAVEEKADGATLGRATFRKVSGGSFYPGMLIREIK